jgi:hypothetical protein
MPSPKARFPSFDRAVWLFAWTDFRKSLHSKVELAMDALITFAVTGGFLYRYASADTVHEYFLEGGIAAILSACAVLGVRFLINWATAPRAIYNEQQAEICRLQAAANDIKARGIQASAGGADQVASAKAKLNALARAIKIPRTKGAMSDITAAMSPLVINEVMHGREIRDWKSELRGAMRGLVSERLFGECEKCLTSNQPEIETKQFLTSTADILAAPDLRGFVDSESIERLREERDKAIVDNNELKRKSAGSEANNQNYRARIAVLEGKRDRVERVLQHLENQIAAAPDECNYTPQNCALWCDGVELILAGSLTDHHWKYQFKRTNRRQCKFEDLQFAIASLRQIMISITVNNVN